MMKKCHKLKNPCKICLSPVSTKNGIKCDGACGNWVHFSCLNYTPGKIKDIKLGVIKISCPCPDCKTPFAKEYRVDEPFSCTNTHCPANRPPSCQNLSCPINVNENQAALPTCPLSHCGVDCKQNSIPLLPPPVSPHYVPEPQYVPDPQPYTMTPDMTYSDSCIDTKRPFCDDVPGDFSSYRAMASSTISSGNTMEQMCNTVEELSNKINELMVQMKNVVNNENIDRGCQQSGCTPAGPRALLPNPCFCPGNPVQRK